MAPISWATIPPTHVNVTRQQDSQAWFAFLADNKQPTAAMCLGFLMVTLLVIGLLLCTGRRWDECNSSNSFRRRICRHCRENAARFRLCSTAENMELKDMGAIGKGIEGPVSWHGSNMLNTSWGWMG